MKIIVPIIPTGSSFQQVGGLETRNTSGFFLQRDALCFKVNINIYLHVIPARILVPCYN